MGVFKNLEAFGFALKRRHGDCFRKHIKFDDYEETLYIQVGLRKDKEEMDWTRYSSQEARDGLKRLTAKKGPRFDYLASPPPNSQPPSRPKPVLPANNEGQNGQSGTGFNWIPPTRDRNTGRGVRESGSQSNVGDEDDDEMT